MNRTIAFFLLAALFIGCTNNNESTNVKDYYFPYKTFLKPVTYTYTNKNNSTEKMYWQMNMNVAGSDTFFITEIFDGHKRITEYLKEKITNTGAVLVEYRLYDIDSTTADSGKIICRIKENPVFNWEVAQDKSYTWSIGYIMPGSTAGDSINFSKTRKYTAEKSSITFNEKRYDTYLFKDDYKILSYRHNGHNKTIEYNADSYYAKTLGLVRYKQAIKGQPDRDFNLVDISSR